MTARTPYILLVNPWIYDFAAYDFWAKPLGLLLLAGLLRHHGFQVAYVDCLDRFHPRAKPTDPRARFGRGPYLKTRLPKPRGLEKIARHYSRYGIKERWFKADLAALGQPDLILLTSLMTYWYPGVQRTVALLKECFPHCPVVLGGVYATLCRAHAQAHSGADRVVAGAGEQRLLPLVAELTGFAVPPRFDPDSLDSWPYPALDLQRQVNYVPLLTSTGCPYRCAYCAAGVLQPRRRLRSAASVVAEILYWQRTFGVKDFVFYDDALLVEAERHAVPLLQGIIKARLKARFHTPNALHIRQIGPRLAKLMFQAGFETVRLGLETTRHEHGRQLDAKVTAEEFKKAVRALQQAGFDRKQIGAYLLVGLPHQELGPVIKTIQWVRGLAVTPILAYYSPIPHTDLWPQALSASRYDLTADPIFTNNAIMPCQKEAFGWEMIAQLKRQAGV